MDKIIEEKNYSIKKYFNKNCSNKNCSINFYISLAFLLIPIASLIADLLPFHKTSKLKEISIKNTL